MSRNAGKSFFPIRSDMIQHSEFRLLSACQVVVLLDINCKLQEHQSLVEHGWREGPFFESDEHWARRLSMSPETFRKARYRLGRSLGRTARKQGLGWIVYAPGFRRKDGSAQRTKYYSAEYASGNRGIQSGPLKRETWQKLIDLLREGKVSHGALVVAALICYFWRVQGGRRMGAILIPKRNIRQLGTTVAIFKKAIAELKQAMPELFTIKETNHEFEVKSWTGDVA